MVIENVTIVDGRLSIWVLQAGKAWSDAEEGGFYLTRELAYEHPVFKLYGISPESLNDKDYFSTEDHWVSLRERPTNQHLVAGYESRCNELGIPFNWHNVY